MSDTYTPETEIMVSIAETVEKLTSHLDWENRLDFKTALSCIELYKYTLGDEGFAAIEKKVDFLSKYTFEKPDADGLMQIKFLEHRLTTLKEHQFHDYEDKEAYLSFVNNEKENNALYFKNISFENAPTNKSTIEKINDHFEKNATVQPDGTVRVKGFAELNRELKKGKPTIGEAIKRMVEEERQLEAELAKTQKQGETPPLEKRKINSKEKIMSDKSDTKEMTVRPSLDAAEAVAKEQAFKNAIHQRNMVLDALKTGTLSCLPVENGFADTKPAVNVVSGSFYHGVNMLDLKDHQKQNGFPTAEYVTEAMVEKAQQDHPDLKIAQDQRTKGIFIHWEEKNKETDEWDRKSVKLYNIAQTTDPKQMKEWGELKQQEKYQEYVDFKKRDNPGWTPPEPKQKGPMPVIECSSTEPEKYLGQYLAAVSMGGKFKASPEQAEEFSKKMEGTLTELKDNGYPDPFKLSKISNEASKYCKDVITETNMTLQKEAYKEQKQEQEQSIGRGR